MEDVELKTHLFTKFSILVRNNLFRDTHLKPETIPRDRKQNVYDFREGQ